MRIAIAGGTGFVGRELTRRLLDDGREVVWLTRRPGRARQLEFDSALLTEVAFGTPEAGHEWREMVAGADAVVNLSGYPIASRWTPRVKELLRHSRVGTNEALVGALSEAGRTGALRTTTFISASGIGIYGDRGDEVLTESAAAGDDWLARLAVDWEGAAAPAASLGVRVACVRNGLALGEEGLLPRMALPMRLFVGGPVGSGAQWTPWLHVSDMAAVYRHVLDTPSLSGPVNACAPEPLRMREFAAALGRALDRPSYLPAPGVALRIVLGEVAPFMLFSQRARPAALLESGFEFRFPSIDAALADAVRRASSSGW